MRISDWSSDVCSSDLGEGDFGDEFGFEPMHLARGDFVDVERRGLAFELGEYLREVGHGAGIEAGADIALVDERIALMLREEERGKGARLRRRGFPADDEDRKSTRLNSSH